MLPINYELDYKINKDKLTTNLQCKYSDESTEVRNQSKPTYVQSTYSHGGVMSYELDDEQFQIFCSNVHKLYVELKKFLDDEHQERG